MTPPPDTDRDGAAASALTGFNHVAVLTADLERFVAFYRDVLGGEPVDVPPQPGTRSRAVRFGPSSALVVVEVDDDPPTDGQNAALRRGHVDHIAFDAPSSAALEAIRQRLVAAGASDGRIHDYGALVTVGFTDPDGMATEVAWLRDPALGELRHPVEVDAVAEVDA